MPKTEDELRTQAVQMIAKSHPVTRSVALLQLIRDVVATDVARACERVQPAKPPTAVPRTHEYEPSKIQLDIVVGSRGRIVRAAPAQPVAAPTTLARPAKPPTADPPPAPNPTRPHTRKDG